MILLLKKFQTAIISTMNETLTNEYGKLGLVTDAWNFVQSKLRCCAVLDNGWLAYSGSWWDRSVNVDIFAMSSKLSENSYFYKLVPVSCCITLIDPLTGWPTNFYRSITQCQNWQYGPPRFANGAHNDAIYYRGCYSAIKSYLERYSGPIGGLAIFIFFLLLFAIVCSVLLLRNMDRSMRQAKVPL
uniref:Tetraspanin family n=1 Tax=Schistocephalus solidus TaxID=70667 RepID=A0A0V0J1H4_SCHSO